MKKASSRKIIVFILIQAFLLCNNAWAGTNLSLLGSNNDCLSPSIQMKSLGLEKAFQQVTQDKKLQDSIINNQITPKIDKKKLENSLNKIFGERDNPVTVTAGKLGHETVPIKIRFNWRWDPKTETKTKRTAVITAEAIEVDYSNLTLYHAINRGRFNNHHPRVMEMLVYFDDDNIEIPHIYVDGRVSGRGIGTAALEKIKILADEFSKGKFEFVHVVNKSTLEILHKIAVEKGQDIDEVQAHITRYPQIYKKGEIDTKKMFDIIGRDIVLSQDSDQEEKRERFITSLVNAIEAMEKNGVSVRNQDQVNKSPVIKMLQSADYKNIKMVFDSYTMTYIDESTGKEISEQMRDIQIHADTKNISEGSASKENQSGFQDFMRQKIKEEGGRISFAEFMKEALYGDHGYFTNDVDIGRDKDFNTYAEGLPFAHAVAKQLVQMWQIMKPEKKFTIVEMGAGNGTLAKNIISYMQKYEPQLYKSLDYVIVDISPRLLGRQRETLEAEFKDLKNIPVRWEKGDALDLSRLEDIEGVFLSNEMPDNFPVHRIKKANKQIQEVYTTFHNGKFKDELGPLSTPELETYVNNLEVEIPEGTEIPVNLNMRIWQKHIAKALKKGFVITIDYGGKIKEISDQPYAAWNKDTNEIKDREEKMKHIYENSGKCDITANVNFFDLARWGRASGLAVNGYTFQRDFLENLGFHEILDDLLDQGENIKNPKSLPVDIVTNLDMKVLIQSKGIDIDMVTEKDNPLKGLEELDGFHRKYQKKISLYLPASVQKNEFILYTNDRGNITPNLFARGKQKVRDYVRTFYYYGNHHNYAKIEDVNRLDVQDGYYVLHFTREKIEDVRIYNDRGEILFDGREFSKDENESRKNALAIEYEEFERRYLTRLDLERMDIDDIPDLFYVHTDGSVLTFPQDFLPQGVIEREPALNQNMDKIIEQAI